LIEKKYNTLILRYISFISLILIIFFSSCNEGKRKIEVIVFHAGSLSVPLKRLAEKYESENPGTSILLEPAGSLVCARKITELKKPCDIIASADYFVIDQLIIPDYALWSIRFATNELVIAFSERSEKASAIDSVNWTQILLSDDVTFARADPDSDPGGYRTVMMFMLGEKYYGIPGLAADLSAKDLNYIRPKEVDLIAILESASVDYIFIYKSVALQHNLRFIELPDHINLGDPEKNSFYNSVSVEVAGSSPDDRIRISGDYINYSLSVLSEAPDREAAEDFVSFILSSEGMEILRASGQDPILPLITDQPDLIPDKLKIFLNTSSPAGYDKE